MASKLDVNELLFKLEKAEVVIQSVNLTNEEYKNEIHRLQEIVDDLKARNEVLTNVHDITQQELIRLAQSHQSNATELDAFVSTTKKLEQSSAQTAKIVNDLMTKNHELKQTNANYQQQMETLSQKIGEQEKDLKAKKQETERLKVHSDAIHEENMILRQQMTRMEQKLLQHEHDGNTLDTFMDSVAEEEENNDVLSPSNRKTIAASHSYMLSRLSDIEHVRLSEIDHTRQSEMDPQVYGQFIFHDHHRHSAYESPKVDFAAEFEKKIKELNDEITHMRADLEEKDAAVKSLNEDLKTKTEEIAKLQKRKRNHETFTNNPNNEEKSQNACFTWRMWAK